MSPRAAVRLEGLGFSRVYDYKDGKQDWLAHGFPTEGDRAHVPRARDPIRTDVPTCRLTDRLEEVRPRVDDAGWDQCIVVDERGKVLGRLRRHALEGPPDQSAEGAMEDGPTTTRPHTDLGEIVGRMRRAEVSDILVSDAHGRLMGVLFLEDAERFLADHQA